MLSCFYITNSYAASFSLFEIEKNFHRINNNNINGIINIRGNNHLVKSVVGGEDGLQAIIHIIHPDISTIYWFAFDLNTLQSNGEIKYGSNCLQGTHLNNIYYFNYINQYILACKDSNSVSFSAIEFKSNVNQLNPYQTNQIAYSGCTDFINFNIIFLLYEGKYILINNFICDTTSTQVYNFPFTLTQYVKPTSEPDSEYLYPDYPTTILETTFLTTIPETTSFTTIPNISSLTTIPYNSPILHSLTTSHILPHIKPTFFHKIIVN